MRVASKPDVGRLAVCGLLLLLGPSAAIAQTYDANGATGDLKRTVLELKYPVLDLRESIEDLGAKVQDLAVKETDTEVQIELAADVLFDFDKAELRSAANDALKKAAGVIREKGGTTIRVERFTDAKGSDAYNQRLSARRANAVKTWLVEKGGLRDRTVTTEGFGARRPTAPNTKPDGSDDPEGRQKNRRVEIIVKKK